MSQQLIITEGDSPLNEPIIQNGVPISGTISKKYLGESNKSFTSTIIDNLMTERKKIKTQMIEKRTLDFEKYKYEIVDGGYQYSEIRTEEGNRIYVACSHDSQEFKDVAAQIIMQSAYDGRKFALDFASLYSSPDGIGIVDDKIVSMEIKSPPKEDPYEKYLNHTSMTQLLDGTLIIPPEAITEQIRRKIDPITFTKLGSSDILILKPSGETIIKPIKPIIANGKQIYLPERFYKEDVVNNSISSSINQEGK